MKDEPNYYAIIPSEVRYSDITPNAKLLYGEISALSNKEGFCWASNKYFAELYSVSETSISLWIKELKENSFIESEVDSNYNRKIYLKGGLKNLKGGFKKTYTPPLRNLKDNTTYNNTKNIGETSSPSNSSPLKEKDFREKCFKLIGWSEERREQKFLKSSIGKQLKAFSEAKEVGLTGSRLKERWIEFESDEFWRKKGFDWFNVISSFNRKR